jgi:hypothetical protein
MRLAAHFAWLGLLPGLLTAALPARADCPLDLGRGTGWVVYSEHYIVAFRPDPMRIDVGEPFALLFNVCTKNDNPAELVRVDAQLLDLERGLRRKPTIVSAGDGRYRAEGLIFDASGRWELDLDVRAGEESERLTHQIIVK